MFKVVCFPAIVLAATIAGCGSGTPKELPVAKPAHGGVMVTLPDEQGFVEVIVETDAAKAGGRKTQGQTRIMAYFYQPDGTTAMSPGPSDVKVKIGLGDGARSVPLASDPKEAGKYTSEPGDYPDGFAGQLEAGLGGQTAEVPIRVR